MKVIAAAVCAGLLGAGVYFWQGGRGEEAVFILPRGHTGLVTVLFNRADGRPAKYEGAARVYEVAPGGVLKTRFAANRGWHGLYKFYYDDGGRLVEIPFVTDAREVSPGRTQVCCFSNGKAGKNPADPPVEFAQFYVGTKEEIDKAAEAGEKVNPAELAK